MGIAGMIFTLIMLGMILGFILVLPVARKLAAYLEQRLQANAPNPVQSGELRQLQVAIQALQEEVERISERQAFTDSLLGDSKPALLPESDPQFQSPSPRDR